MNYALRKSLVFATFLLLLAPDTARAAEFHAARITLDPPRPFVNQPVSFNLEIVVSPGCELQNIQLGGLPGGTQLELGELVAQPATRETHNGQTVEIHRYRSEGRAAAPLEVTVQPIIQFMLVERRNVGFFSSWNSKQQRLRLPATALSIRPLPTDNRPADFSGAVGRFTLTGRLTPAVVMPQDIVNLTLELTGSGHLGDIRPALPKLDPARFKVYPATEKRGTGEQLLTITQSIIPQSTQAVQVAEARFTYFDTATERYQTATAGPFSLTFTTRRPDEAPAIRNVAVTSQRQPEAEGTFTIDATMHREIRRVIPFAVGLLAALAFIAIVRPTHKRLAVIAGLAILVGATWGARALIGAGTATLTPLTQTVRLRLAPGEQARHSVELPAGMPVQLLETSDGWIRIEARGRRGWVPLSAIGKPQ